MKDDLVKLRRVLNEQKRKNAKLTRASRRLQRAAAAAAPALDLDFNPFCEAKQRRDYEEMRGSRAVKRALAPGNYRKLGSGNNLQDVLDNTMVALGCADDGKDVAFEPGRSGDGLRPGSQQSLRRPGSPGSGGSPRGGHAHAPRHLDVLSVIRDESRALERKAAAAAAAVREDLPRAGLLNADDLYRLVHAPPRKQQAGKKKKRGLRRGQQQQQQQRAQANAELRSGWNDRVYDPEVERAKDASKRRNEFNAVMSNGIRKDRDTDMKSYLRKMSRISAVDRPQPFCSERQETDQLMMSKLLFMARKEYQLADALGAYPDWQRDAEGDEEGKAEEQAAADEGKEEEEEEEEEQQQQQQQTAEKGIAV